MIRRRSEIIEKEGAIIEALNCAKEAAEAAEKEGSPCRFEALENWRAEEEELKALRQFKDATADVIRKALEEIEKVFLSELAEVLSYFSNITIADLSGNDEEMENLLSPALAYDKEGKSVAPASVNEARRKAFMLWRRKYILDWLLKQND